VLPPEEEEEEDEDEQLEGEQEDTDVDEEFVQEASANGGESAVTDGEEAVRTAVGDVPAEDDRR
jgi:general stress protein YciG